MDTTSKKRKRRTDKELIEDLQRQIEEAKERRSSKELLRTPEMKAAAKALYAIDCALQVTADQGATNLRHALADARKPLVAELSRNGFTAPKPRLPRGRRPKTEVIERN
ncbi:MAG: hypothetical protein ACI8X5_000224 [Planctomycetota bacterium]|jgi:hypothetical protein